ncbi:MAG: tRNA pseudouridine(55) synthase TruB [Clostridiales bacterium]|nr:tRNA pseudouridine(55) synthase TruB [Clostridiales bacterium]
MNGVINIFKNKGMTSFDVVRIVKKIANTKKVGHTGTLDPEASGVLPICIGKGTKIIDYIMSSDKSYYVKFKLGIETTTYDLEGEIISEKDISSLNSEMILKEIGNFKGEYMQIPPMYSALKKNGVRLYDLARQGIEIEREGRKVNIIDIKNINIELPYVSMEVTCSKGTYIRSLCKDIGDNLKVGGTVVELRRTVTASFKEEDSININDLTQENITDYLIPIEKALKSYPKLHINKGFSKLLINGVKVYDKRLTNVEVVNDALYRVYDEKNNFIGLGKKDGEGFKIEKLLVV